MNPRFSWPWGRISPARRMDEIDRMIQRHQSTLRIIETQAREAKRLHAKSIEALQKQKRIVEVFLDEDRRKSVMEQAYAIEGRGIPVLEKIATAETTEEIEEILRQNTPEDVAESLLSPLEGPKIFVVKESGSDLFSGGLDDASDLFDSKEGEGL